MANTLLLVLLLFREQERTPTCGHKNPTSRVGLLKVFAPKIQCLRRICRWTETPHSRVVPWTEAGFFPLIYLFLAYEFALSVR